MDFASEIDGPTEAMELRGIDTSQGLPAPMRRGNDNDAFVAYYATLLGNRPPGTLAELDDCMVAYWDAKAPY
ncbi:hypothetical protein [Paraburkholderia sp. CI3]|uniref:hypothetical protein n=1 Tax=Paraburkholderia sp. CI3 TaxID=2991060 RepID=UPI003D25CA87